MTNLAREHVARRRLLQLAGGLAALGAAAPAQAAEAAAPGAGGTSVALVATFVSNLERSLKFYQALGFDAGTVSKLPVGQASPVSRTLYQSKGRLSSITLKKDGMTLELLCLEEQDVPPQRTTRTMGLSHISLRVDSIARVAGIIKANGGTVRDDTKVTVGAAGKEFNIVLATDPDGSGLALLGPA
jgi:catechol 2,3-dioxygenase-like lactoylglutathione lyase family enzyme